MRHGNWGMVGLMAVGTGALFALSDGIQDFAEFVFGDDAQRAIRKAVKQAPPTQFVPESDYYTARDSYCSVRPYIDGYYGDKWVEEGGSREDLEGFMQWSLLKYGSDFH